jgi:diaminopimelate decarboxylase
MGKERLSHLQTPCFVIDEEELKHSIRGFQKALNENFQEGIVGYSVKTNSLPWCLRVAGHLGCYAEVVSYDEYNVALLCGFEKNRIIYNGPMKSKETFLDAIEHGAIVNIETHRELDWLKELPKNKKFNVGLRLNINISQVSPEDADGDNDNSRFGFCAHNEEFFNALNVINALDNIELSGLHIHRTSHARRVEFYEQTIDYTAKIIEQYHLKLNYIDVGGGYFGIFGNKPSYEDYSNGFYKVLKKHGLENLKVIVEPGNGLVASAFQFVSSVIDVKDVDAVTFVNTDGSRNDIDPFFHKTDYMKEIIYTDKNRPLVETQVIAGCTCLEYDRLFTLKNKPKMKVGDYIIYNNVGAYTFCLSPLFIRFFPNFYVKENGKIELVRRAWNANDYMMGEMK